MKNFNAFLGVALGLSLTTARADVNVDVSIWHGYDFYYPALSVTVDPGSLTYARLESPNGLVWINRGTNNDSSGFFLTNLSGVITECTNGLWKLYLNREHPSEEVYQFKMNISGVTSNVLGDVVVLAPLSGSAGVTNRPTFMWSGSTNLPWVDASAYHQVGGASYYQTLPGTTGQWTPAGVLTSGMNSLFLNYYSNNYPGISFSVATNHLGTPLVGWSAAGSLHTYAISSFEVLTPGGGAGTAHTNLAHYRFDNDGPGLGDDTSGNGNHFNGGSSWGLPVQDFDSDAQVGAEAVRFYGNSSLTHSPPSEAFTNLTAALANSFSVSLWLKTSSTVGADTDDAVDGAVVIWNYDSGLDDVIPVSVTGNKVAFHTGDEFGNSQTLHSTSDVADDSYHHIVVTRNRETGEKCIYVDGAREATEFGTTRVLNANDYYLSLGGVLFHSYDGLVDDVQLYAGVLSATEVTQLYTNPGVTIPDTTLTVPLAAAVNTTNLVWTTSGDANWFGQTATSHDGQAAARSGAIGDDGISTLQTEVYGTNTLTFWWKADTEQDADFVEFYDNGDMIANLSGDTGWEEFTYELGDGPHVLWWRYIKSNGAHAGQDAVFLDEVNFAYPAQRAPITFSLTLIREQRHALDEFNPNQSDYIAFPFIDSLGTTMSHHRVETPGGHCHGLFGPTNAYSASSSFLADFSALANELTNGNWKVWLNKDTPQEEFYTFTMSSLSFGSNSLPAVAIISPANGATGVAAHPAYTWAAVPGWDEVLVNATQSRFGTNHDYGNALLSPATTAWASGPVLEPGTNVFMVQYAAYDRSTEFAISAPFTNWSVSNIRFEAKTYSGFVVGSALAAPSLSISLTPTNTVVISWPSPSAGFGLYANTNLATTNWTAVGTTPADNGSTKTVVINPPAGNQFFRLIAP